MRDVIDAWLADEERADRVAHVEHQPPRGAIFDDLDLEPRLAAALAERGIERLYRHQAEAIRLARAGTHTVVVAGTASGKSLCYQVPIAEAALADKRSTALCLFPTKALTQDQFRSFHRLGLPELTAAVYDGDTETEARAWIRRQANVVLTNPDMLHIGILPHHARWARFLKRLRFVVVDEVHVLRGIFGSHVANVLRRLRRLAAHYGSDPTFVTCSATIGNPADLVERLTGLDIEAIEQDTSPAGAKEIVIWNPPVDEDDRRPSALTEATDLFVDLVGRDRHTIAFTRSRKGTELVYRWARDRLDDDRKDRIAPYRAGYLAKDRREVERRLFSGELLGVTATNALELGIDVGGLDAAIVTTFPGTIASFRQQAGRAGRTLDDSLAVLVAGEDALDQYFAHHPEELFGRPAEAAVVNPVNPEVLTAHAACAAYEKPLDHADTALFGPELEEVVPGLVDRGDLRLRDGLLWYAHRAAPAPGIDIRTAGGPPFTIVDTEGALVGSVDEGRVFSQAHPGAVYLHQGEGYVVEELHLGDRMVVAARREVGYYTQPQEDTWVEITAVHGRDTAGRFPLRHGLVEVEHHVTGFKRKSVADGTVLGYEPLELPSRRFTTQAVWVEVPDDIIEDARIEARDLPGTLHAAEHTSIAMLPLYAICDRWDVGGLSTNFHPQIGGSVWFVYDGYPGGAGISPMAFSRGERHLAATLDALVRCPCSAGCPSCVQSPKCGNFNEPLDKAGAIALLETGLTRRRAATPG
ncbi:MAG TPA: DEAD/DEAH box helicase [Acidimicrobiia bacterium]|nr:DEAD/DEAH box helicase [Acidimicrobiia bacterium]